MLGSATFTTVASRITMNCARQTMTRTSQRLVSPEGGGSTSSSPERPDVGAVVTRTSGWERWGAADRINERSALLAGVALMLAERRRKR